MTNEEIEKKVEELNLKAETLDGALRLLAEECAEATQACLKYIRSLDCNFIDTENALKHLAEEIGDVELAAIGVKTLMKINNPEFDDLIHSSEEYKVKRWATRVESEKGIVVNVNE